MRYRVAAFTLIGVIFCATAGLALTFSTGGASDRLPKLKESGVIIAAASSATPTASLSHYKVAWSTGLAFRDSPATEALTITPARHDPEDSGLHLTADAARDLAAQLARAVSEGLGAVQVDNRRDHAANLYFRLSDVDAASLAVLIGGAVFGH